MTVIEAGILTMLALPNTPYSGRRAAVPSLLVRHFLTPNLYVQETSSARCEPDSAMRWNPVTAAWSVRAGVVAGGLDLSVGHRSEHGIDRIVSQTESMDFVEMKYRIDSK